MKYVIVFGISLLFISNLKAQSNSFKDSTLSQWQKNRNFFNHAEHLQQKNNPPILKTYFKEKLKPIDPSVLKLTQPELTFVREYNHSSIYQSAPDNMFIKKPDSTIIFNMPVADNN